MLEIKDEFGDERKSPIKESSEAKVFSEEETLVTESITVVLSEAGWIRSAKGHEIDPSSLSYRGEDKLQDFCRGKSNQLAVFLDSNGKAYLFRVTHHQQEEWGILYLGELLLIQE